MAVVCGPHTLRTAGRDAHLDGAGSLRAHALVRRVGEPAQQHRHGDLLRGRQGAGNLLRAEPFLRAVRGAVRLGLGDPHLDQRPRSAADRRGAHRHRGRPLRLAFGHRHPVAHPRSSWPRTSSRATRYAARARCCAKASSCWRNSRSGSRRSNSNTTTPRRRSPRCTSTSWSTDRTPTASSRRRTPSSTKRPTSSTCRRPPCS